MPLPRPPAPANATALTDGTTTLTYAGLHDLVTREAEALRRNGIGPGSLVPLPSQRGRAADGVVSLLAVLAAGAAFTPVATGAAVEQTVRDVMSDRSAWPGHLAPLHNPAYVMPTSGSTGPVKHTVVTREGLRAVFGGLHARFHDHLPPLAVWTQLHSLTFGFSICEVIGCLTFGGTLAVVEREEPVTFAALSRQLAEQDGPHVVCLTPSELSVLISVEHAPLPSHLVLSGEPAHRAPLRDLFARAGAAPPVVLNTYAATETSGQVTADLVTAARLPEVLAGHVGHPLPATEVVVLGQDGVAIPPEDTLTEGEIEVRGPTVSAGYLNVSDHMAKFVATGPKPAFRTGDRGRWAPDGGLVVTGRAERRVKLAGRWLALDEVERALTEDGVAAEAAAVIEEYTVDGASAGRLLVALVPRAAAGSEAAARARRLVVRLIDGPATVRVVVCETLPHTTNGKIDLAVLRQAPQASARVFGAADSVLRVWTELLGAGVSTHANLFEIGVDSLGVIAAAARLTEALGCEVTPTFLLDHPRIALQIEALADRTSHTRPPAPPVDPRGSAADRRRAARRPTGTPVSPDHIEGKAQ